MHTETVEVEYHIDELCLEIKVEGQVGIVNAGIGHYEFQGSPAFDESPYAECQDFDVMRDDLTEEELSFARAYVNKKPDLFKRLLEDKFNQENR